MENIQFCVSGNEPDPAEPDTWTWETPTERFVQLNRKVENYFGADIHTADTPSRFI